MYQINYNDFFKNNTQIERKQTEIKKEKEENDEFLNFITNRSHIDKLIPIPKEKRAKDYKKNDCILYDPYNDSYCYCLKYKTYIYITDEEYANRNDLFEVKDKKLLFKKDNNFLIGRNEEGEIKKYKNYEEYVFLNEYEEKTFGEFDEKSNEIKVYENSEDYFKRKCKIFNSYDDIKNNNYEDCGNITEYYKEKFFYNINNKYKNIYYKYCEFLKTDKLVILTQLKKKYNKYFENDKPKDIINDLIKSDKILDILNEDFFVPINQFFNLYYFLNNELNNELNNDIKSDIENLDEKYKDHINKNPNYFDIKNYKEIKKILNLIKNLKNKLENEKEIILKMLSSMEHIIKDSLNYGDDQLNNILKYNSKSLFSLYINAKQLDNFNDNEFFPKYKKNINDICVTIYIYRKIIFYIKTCKTKLENFKTNIENLIKTLSNQELNISKKAKQFKEKVIPQITNLLIFIVEFIHTETIVNYIIKLNIKNKIDNKAIEYLENTYSNLKNSILKEKENILKNINEIAKIFLDNLKSKEEKTEELKNLVLNEKRNLLKNIDIITQMFSNNIELENKTLKTLILIKKEDLTRNIDKIIEIFLSNLKNQKEKNEKLEEKLFSKEKENLLNITKNVKLIFSKYINNNLNLESTIENLLSKEKENLSKVIGEIIKTFLENINDENVYILKALIPEKIVNLLKNIDNLEKKDLTKNMGEIIEIFLNSMEINSKNNNILKTSTTKKILNILKNINEYTRENLLKNIDIITDQFLENTKIENKKNNILKISIFKKTIDIIKTIYNYINELKATKYRFNNNVLEIISLENSIHIENQKLFNNINKIIKTFLNEKNLIENKLIEFNSPKKFILEKKDNLLKNIDELIKTFLINIKNKKNDILQKFVSIEKVDLLKNIDELEKKFQSSQNNKITNNEDEFYYIYNLKTAIENLYSFINAKDENNKNYFFENEKFIEKCENFKNLFNLFFNENQYKKSKKIYQPLYNPYNFDESHIPNTYMNINCIKNFINNSFKINLDNLSLEEKIIKQLNHLKHIIISNLQDSIIPNLKKIIIKNFIIFLEQNKKPLSINKFDLFTKIEIYNINYLILQIRNEIKNKVDIVLKDILQTIKEIEKSNKIHKYKKIEYKKQFNEYINDLKEVYITILSPDFDLNCNLI